MKIFLKIIFIILVSFFALVGFLTTCLIVAAIILVTLYPDYSDYCIEDGDCEAGRVVISGDKEITISEKTCKEQGWVWYDKHQFCKIDFYKANVRLKH